MHANYWAADEHPEREPALRQEISGRSPSMHEPRGLNRIIARGTPVLYW